MSISPYDLALYSAVKAERESDEGRTWFRTGYDLKPVASNAHEMTIESAGIVKRCEYFPKRRGPKR